MDLSCAKISGLLGDTGFEPLDDESLARSLGLTVEDLARRSRGLVRTSAPDGDGPAILSARLARALLERMAIDPATIGQIVFATTTPDLTFPGSACLVQAELGIPGTACLDVRSQCTGFLTVLDVATKFVSSGVYERVLVAAADVPTHVMRYDGVNPDLAVLTGDGSAVAIVERGSGSGQVLSSVTKIDGARYREFWCEFPASRHMDRDGVARGERMSGAAFHAGRHFPQIDLPAVRTTALAETPAVLSEAISRAGLQSVDVLVLAHVDPEVEDELQVLLAPKARRIVRRRRAYSFGSTLPLALMDASAAGDVVPGVTVAVVTSGAGASWGAAVLRW